MIKKKVEKYLNEDPLGFISWLIVNLSFIFNFINYNPPIEKSILFLLFTILYAPFIKQWRELHTNNLLIQLGQTIFWIIFALNILH